MMFFSFTAPALLEPDADTDAVLSASDVFYNASRESLERLVKIKKLVLWLKAEMEKSGGESGVRRNRTPTTRIRVGTRCPARPRTASASQF
jgi:hypothetical protein